MCSWREHGGGRCVLRASRAVIRLSPPPCACCVISLCTATVLKGLTGAIAVAIFGCGMCKTRCRPTVCRTL